MARNSSNKSKKSSKSDKPEQKTEKSAKESKKKESPQNKKTPPVEVTEGESGAGTVPKSPVREIIKNTATEDEKHSKDVPESSGSQFNIGTQPHQSPPDPPSVPPGLEVHSGKSNENATEISTEKSYVVLKEKSGKKPAVEETSGEVQIVSDTSDEDVPKLDPVPAKGEEDNRSRASESSEKSRKTRTSRCTIPADYIYMEEEENRVQESSKKRT